MGFIIVAVQNGAVRASITMAAHEAGHTALAVMDSEELLRAVEQKRPNLLFLDPALARMDTVEPLKHMQLAGHLRDMRVLLVDDRCAEPAAWVAVGRQLVEGVIDSFRKDDIRWAIDAAIGMGKVAVKPPPAAGRAPVPPPAPPPSSKPFLPPMKPLGPAGRGSTALPPRTGSFAPARSAEAPEAAPPPPAAPPGPTILVVEDIPSLRALLGINLEAAGWSVIWAESSEEAMRKIETEGCEVLLSDVNLPGLSGDQLVLLVRKRYPGVRCLLMTALPEERWPRVPAEVPIFAKPLNMEALIKSLALGLKRAPRKK